MSRYHRQEILIGAEGQRRLGEAHVLVVGCGALGCVAADLLVRAGVGQVTIVDRDVVELTNLQRQPLFLEEDVGEAKAERAALRLGAANRDVEIRAWVADLTGTNAERLAGFDQGQGPQVVVDGTDNFESRYLLNDLAIKHAVAFVYGGAVASKGMAMVVAPGTPCLRCVFPEAPGPATQPTCDTAGVLAGATAMVGARQAAEAIKVIVGGPVARGLWEADLWTNRERRIDVGQPRPDCICCAQRRFEYLDGALGAGEAVLCGQDGVQIGSGAGRVDLAALAGRLAPHGQFEVRRFLLRGTLNEGLTLTVFHDGRTIVGGTREIGEARRVHARYVGA